MLLTINLRFLPFAFLMMNLTVRFSRHTHSIDFEMCLK